jgi:nucleoside-diphosphate-sugar epimerase
MKILITGGNGFITKSIIDELNNHDVTVTTRDQIDLTNNAAVNLFFENVEYDVVVHTAAAGVTTPMSSDISILDQNLAMYYNLLNNKDKFKRFINIGSGAEIHFNAYPYGLSKSIISKSIIQKSEFYNLRVYGIFGPHELQSRFIKSNLLRYINKSAMTIAQDKQMDFFYIKDLTTLLDGYINGSCDNLQTEMDCVYSFSPTLYDIASYINTLDDYQVDIKVLQPGQATSYTGIYTANGEYIGLQRGIKEMYDILKNKIVS